jgi:hypothetical protein
MLSRYAQSMPSRADAKSGRHALFRRCGRKALNLYLFVRRVDPATRAELLDGELFRLPFLVSGGRVIAPFAGVALHPD